MSFRPSAGVCVCVQVCKCVPDSSLRSAAARRRQTGAPRSSLARRLARNKLTDLHGAHLPPQQPSSACAQATIVTLSRRINLQSARMWTQLIASCAASSATSFARLYRATRISRCFRRQPAASGRFTTCSCRKASNCKGRAI